eukprot:214793-Ditylum_brightwellii.AAC.1
MLLEDEELERARSKRSPEEAIATKNMYIMLWKSLIHRIKTAIQTITDDNKEDGPALLCHLLCQYIGTSKFCSYVSKTLKTLQDAGGNDKQAPLKLYEALVLTSVDGISSKTRAYKVVIVAKDKQLHFTKLTTISKAKYTALKMSDK